MTVSNRQLAVLASALTLAFGLAAMQAGGGWTADGIMAGTRLTARLAFPWFLLAFVASSLMQLWPDNSFARWSVLHRRGIGLGFAGSHFVHLGFILCAALVFKQELAQVAIIGGGFVYVLITLMALTSNGTAIRRLGLANWKRLHTVGIWATFLIFTNSYVGRISEKPWLGIPATILLVTALGLRLAAMVKRRQRLQAA